MQSKNKMKSLPNISGSVNFSEIEVECSNVNILFNSFKFTPLLDLRVVPFETDICTALIAFI